MSIKIEKRSSPVTNDDDPDPDPNLDDLIRHDPEDLAHLSRGPADVSNGNNSRRKRMKTTKFSADDEMSAADSLAEASSMKSWGQQHQQQQQQHFQWQYVRIPQQDEECQQSQQNCQQQVQQNRQQPNDVKNDDCANAFETISNSSDSNLCLPAYNPQKSLKPLFPSVSRQSASGADTVAVAASQILPHSQQTVPQNSANRDTVVVSLLQDMRNSLAVLVPVLKNMDKNLHTVVQLLTQRYHGTDAGTTTTVPVPAANAMQSAQDAVPIPVELAQIGTATAANIRQSSSYPPVDDGDRIIAQKRDDAREVDNGIFNNRDIVGNRDTVGARDILGDPGRDIVVSFSEFESKLQNILQSSAPVAESSDDDVCLSEYRGSHGSGGNGTEFNYSDDGTVGTGTGNIIDSFTAPDDLTLKGQNKWALKNLRFLNRMVDVQNESYLSMHKIETLLKVAKSRYHFSTLLLLEIFTDEELDNCTISGVNGYGKLDPHRVDWVSMMTFKLYPVTEQGQIYMEWAKCRNIIDTKLRKLSRLRK